MKVAPLILMALVPWHPGPLNLMAQGAASVPQLKLINVTLFIDSLGSMDDYRNDFRLEFTMRETWMASGLCDCGNNSTSMDEWTPDTFPTTMLWYRDRTWFRKINRGRVSPRGYLTISRSGDGSCIATRIQYVSGMNECPVLPDHYSDYPIEIHICPLTFRSCESPIINNNNIGADRYGPLIDCL